jgi:histidinol dehydrogenase
MSVPLEILDWPSLVEESRREALRRPAQRDAAALLEKAGRIVREVRTRGDAALCEFTAQLDGVRLESFAVGEAESEAAAAALTGEQLKALQRAIGTVTRSTKRSHWNRYAYRRRTASRVNGST